MKVLYIGGTGEVSPGCISAGLELGQDITVFNRGTSGFPLPPGVKHTVGDLNDDAKFYALGKQKWDVVCQFRTFDLKQLDRDITAFAGNCSHFVFISTAMVYQKPFVPYRITESAPKGNPYSSYATNKLAIEQRLMELHDAGKFNVTIVRPSHTICYSFPGVFIPDEHMALRMVQGKPVISHGDGTGLWTLTRSEDFGRAFAKLLNNPKAFGQAFHITADQPHTWDSIFHAMAESLGTSAKLVHVPTDMLVKYDPKWAQPLHGDKSSCAVFDNSKVKQAVGGWECQYGMPEIIQMSAQHVKKKLKTYEPDMKLDALLDRIIQEQMRLGS